MHVCESSVTALLMPGLDGAVTRWQLSDQSIVHRSSAPRKRVNISLCNKQFLFSSVTWPPSGAVSDAVDRAVGGTELQVNMKPIGPEAELQLRLRNKATRLSAIGSRFIVVVTWRTGRCLSVTWLPAGPDPRQLSIPPILLQTRVKSGLFSCYININYLQGSQLTSSPSFLIWKNKSFAFLLLLWFCHVSAVWFSPCIHYYIFGRASLACTVDLRRTSPLCFLGLTHSSFSIADIFGANLLFCASFQYLRIWPRPAKNFKQLQVFSVSPSYSWQCGKACEAACRPQEAALLLILCSYTHFSALKTHQCFYID